MRDNWSFKGEEAFLVDEVANEVEQEVSWIVFQEEAFQVESDDSPEVAVAVSTYLTHLREGDAKLEELELMPLAAPVLQ